ARDRGVVPEVALVPLERERRPRALLGIERGEELRRRLGHAAGGGRGAAGEFKVDGHGRHLDALDLRHTIAGFGAAASLYSGARVAVALKPARLGRRQIASSPAPASPSPRNASAISQAA